LCSLKKKQYLLKWKLHLQPHICNQNLISCFLIIYFPMYFFDVCGGRQERRSQEKYFHDQKMKLKIKMTNSDD